ncbi:His Kinase A (phospho-acceptor) domain-containing protein [Halogranum rubrum]|uniref:histidine kinase n=1 Tax=Halogranum rubrum TaxID=553466 RepID=A0A1I4F120_9EURY|nr:GAF domain-containing sensor histidine kinase [Halogranum rubrum]SFL10466.1 His Kinase A (phospho-acceptor) domain-containing protein [Halogranum rubrum]
MTNSRRKVAVLDTLHAATRRLMDAEDKQSVCEIAVETASDVLGLPLNAIWLYDESTHSLRPAAETAQTRDVIGKHPTFTPGNSLSWEVYESGTVQWFDDVREEDAVHNRETPIRSEMILPLGAYGVMNIGSTTTAAFDESDVHLAKILAANTEAALERAEREQILQSQNDRLSEFVSVVSHDLRNPLTIATGRLDLAADECDSPHLNSVERALDRMEVLIEHLLTLARQGKRIGRTSPVDVGDVAARAWENVETGDASLGVDETYSTPADEERLSQLLENLFRNAVFHAGGDVSVRVGVLPGNNGFYVEDDGPGIPPDERQSVFDYGYTTGGGTGLGLTIVRVVAEAHGWEVHVTDSTADGARFEFSTRPDATPGHPSKSAEETESEGEFRP